jgi:hypothetical protein
MPGEGLVQEEEFGLYGQALAISCAAAHRRKGYSELLADACDAELLEEEPSRS